MRFLLFFLFLPVWIFSQKGIQISEHAKMTYSKFDQAFYVFDDSISYLKYNLKKHNWQKRRVFFKLEDTWTYHEFIKRFHPVAVSKNHLLFVLDGCGEVYEFNQDTIKRLDNSFDQKNQFASALYEHQNKVYMFGGYGLFQVKNLHTYFDPQTKEWYEVCTNGTQKPSPRSTPFYVQTKKAIYILGGTYKDVKKQSAYNDIWRFDLKQKRWSSLGELNSELIKRLELRGFVQNKDYRIFAQNNKLTILQVQKNQYQSYISSRYFNMHRIIADQDLKWLLVATHPSHNGNKITASVQPLSKILFGKAITHELYHPAPFFKQISQQTVLLIFLSICIAVLLIIQFTNSIKRKLFIQTSAPLDRGEFSDLEWQVLLLIKENGEMELSALNDFFNEPGLSYETLKKRRESFLRSLRIKLALLTQRDAEELLPEKKHPLDKRMKIICWNQDIILDN
ncbi:MAG: kelch repeat-containing protein [Flavobacteriales bacterium]